MVIRVDPENNETRALFDIANFSGQQVLEIGEEDVLLAVQPKEGAHIDPRELLNWCAERLASHLVPRYVRVMRLPVTPSERVEKQTLREQGIAPGTYDAENDVDRRPIKT